MSSTAHSFVRRTLSVGALAALAAFAAASFEGRESHARPSGQPQGAVAGVVAASNPNLIADVAEGALPSVVSIRTERVGRLAQVPMLERFFREHRFGDGEGSLDEEEVEKEFRMPTGQGSGVVIDAKGLIVTNHHVVAGADGITVVLADGREVQADVKGSDAKSDLAVLQLRDPPRDLRAMPFGDSERLRLGEIVLAIGNPFGLEGTVTMGIVSAKGRNNVHITDYEDFIQTDAAINPGNSGGALVDLQGRLVGINSAIASRSGGNNGVGFAIPAHMVRPIVDDLLDDGQVARGWLGVSIQDLDGELAERFKTEDTRGALVADVQEGSPAAAAGIQRGDVIVRIDERDVANTAQLRNYVAMQRAGRQVDVRLIRDGKEKTLVARLGELGREAAVAKSEPNSGSRALDGVTVAPLDDRSRKLARVPDELKQGVVVTELDEQSEAAQAGLRQGDVVLEIDRKPVADVQAFEAAAKNAGTSTLLLVRRQGGTLYLMWRR